MKGRAPTEAQEIVRGLKERGGICSWVSGRGSWGVWYLRMALPNGQDFREETHCAKAQRRTATAGPVRVGQTLSSCHPL